MQVETKSKTTPGILPQCAPIDANANAHCTKYGHNHVTLYVALELHDTQRAKYHFQRAIEARRSVMGEEIYEDSQGEGTRSLVWVMEEDVQQEVNERVRDQRLIDTRAEEQ